jgi:hypothetical protein
MVVGHGMTTPARAGHGSASADGDSEPQIAGTVGDERAGPSRATIAWTPAVWLRSGSVVVAHMDAAPSRVCRPAGQRGPSGSLRPARLGDRVSPACHRVQVPTHSSHPHQADSASSGTA